MVMKQHNIAIASLNMFKQTNLASPCHKNTHHTIIEPLPACMMTCCQLCFTTLLGLCHIQIILSIPSNLNSNSLGHVTCCQGHRLQLAISWAQDVSGVNKGTLLSFVPISWNLKNTELNCWICIWYLLHWMGFEPVLLVSYCSHYFQCVFPVQMWCPRSRGVKCPHNYRKYIFLSVWYPLSW